MKEERVQWHSLNLGGCEVFQLIVVSLRIEAKTNSRTRTTCSSLALLRGGSTDPELLQALHLILWVVADLLDFARVYDEAKTVDCD